MKDEIKEILELFKEYASGGMSGLYPPGETIKNLLDYITNLQEENKKLKDLCNKYEKEHNTVFKLWKGKLKETMDETLIQKQHDRIKKLEQINEEHRKLNGELRERCAYLERSNNRREDTILELRQEIYQFEDYKTRNEKAIEHIEEHQLIYTSQYEEESNFDNHLLEILQGSDE